MKLRKRDIDFNTSIKERDDYRCVVCKRRPIAIHLHHLLPYTKFPEYRFDDNNVVSLCADCHGEFHSMYGHEVISEREFNQYKERKGIVLAVIKVMLNSYKEFGECAIDFYNRVIPKVWNVFRDTQADFSLHEVFHAQYYQIVIESIVKHVQGEFAGGVSLELLKKSVSDTCEIEFVKAGYVVEGWHI